MIDESADVYSYWVLVFFLFVLRICLGWACWVFS